MNNLFFDNGAPGPVVSWGMTVLGVVGLWFTWYTWKRRYKRLSYSVESTSLAMPNDVKLSVARNGSEINDPYITVVRLRSASGPDFSCNKGDVLFDLIPDKESQNDNMSILDITYNSAAVAVEELLRKPAIEKGQSHSGSSDGVFRHQGDWWQEDGLLLTSPEKLVWRPKDGGEFRILSEGRVVVTPHIKMENVRINKDILEASDLEKQKQVSALLLLVIAIAMFISLITPPIVSTGFMMFALVTAVIVIGFKEFVAMVKRLRTRKG